MEDEEEIVLCDECSEPEDDCQCCDECSCHPCQCCEECGWHIDNCNTCEYCGDHISKYDDYCEYHVPCGECGYLTDDCECRSGYGESEVPPWQSRGHHVSAAGTVGNWPDVWPEINQGLDIVQSAADFYLLEAMSAGVPVKVPGVKPHRITPEDDARFFDLMGIHTAKAQAKFVALRAARLKERAAEDHVFNVQYLMGSAEAQLEAHVDKIDESLLAYGHMAIAGELRHHMAIGGSVLSNSRSDAWCGWRKVFNVVGNQALADAAELFREFPEGEGYGGELWATCCDVLFDRVEGNLGPDGPDGKINKRLFCDRVWTLQHNGGSFLNKIHWKIRNKRMWDLGRINHVLDAHAADETGYPRLLSVASEPVVSLWTAYTKAANAARVALGLETLPVADIETVVEYHVCGSCQSNADVGHFMGCNNVEYYHAPHDYMTYTDEDYLNTTFWVKPEGLFYDAAGKPKAGLDAQVEIKATFTLTYMDGTQYHQPEYVKTTTLGAILDGKAHIHLKRFNKNNTAKGDIRYVDGYAKMQYAGYNMAAAGLLYLDNSGVICPENNIKTHTAKYIKEIANAGI